MLVLDRGRIGKLVKSSTSWVLARQNFLPPGAADLEDAGAVKRIKGVLNKLTEEKFDVKNPTLLRTRAEKENTLICFSDHTVQSWK